MSLLRRRHDGPEGERFLMREKLLSIGDDFWIENDQGERAYKVNGKALRVRQTFVLEDTSGDEVARAKRMGQDTTAIQEASRARSQHIKQLGIQLDSIEYQLTNALMTLPNLPHLTVPVGSTAPLSAAMAPSTFVHPNVWASCSFLSTPFWIDKTVPTSRCLTHARAVSMS